MIAASAMSSCFELTVHLTIGVLTWAFHLLFFSDLHRFPRTTWPALPSLPRFLHTDVVHLLRTFYKYSRPFRRDIGGNFFGADIYT